MVMSSEQQRIKDIKIKIENEAGPTFCLAKWHHVTMYLQSGETHSCYHPQPHKIPLEELKDNPSALHNTQFKKDERKMMLEGEKPTGCQYCWNIEAMGPDYISDRHIRNASIFTEERYELKVHGIKILIQNTWKSTLVTNVISSAVTVIQNIQLAFTMRLRSMALLLQ
jgi:hypothetical protein